MIAGPSRHAIRTGSRAASVNAALTRGYTPEELAEIRAARIRLIRDLTAGPQNPGGGGAVLSHPTLGRIVISNPGQLPPVGEFGGSAGRPNPGLIAGPSPIGGALTEAPEGGSGGGAGGGSGGGSGEFPILVPGRGFAGPTAQPPAAGDASMLGYDAKAIARWDVVPYQTFDGLFEIGVVAFHMRGIDRVEFSVNGGDWVTVREMTLNPRTQVEEYWVGLDAALFDQDGPVEVRAVVYPTVGIPRVLAGEMDWDNRYQGPQWTGEHSMFLFANGEGTSDEIVVKLPQGIYEWGAFPGIPDEIPDDRWLVIQPQAGASVTILPGLWRDQPRFVRLHDLDLIQPDAEAHVRGSTHNILWFDEVEYVGRGMYEDANAIKARHHFWTNSVVRESRWGQAEHFVRNSRFERIGDDTFNRSYLILNTSVNNQGTPPAHLRWHPGVIANPIEHDNRIYFGLDIITRQKAWAFRNGTWDHWEHTDVAIVGCVTNKTTEGNQLLYLGGQVNHMVIKDNVWRGDQSWNYRLTDRVSEPRWKFNPHNVYMENNDWYGDPSWMPNPSTLEGVTIIPIGSDRPIGG
ncbi:MAG: hypothetical protein RIB58_10190 [Phycisphaerales bacterium]